MQSTFDGHEERASQGPRRLRTPETAQTRGSDGYQGALVKPKYCTLYGGAFRHHRREHQLSVRKDRHDDRHDGGCRATTRQPVRRAILGHSQSVVGSAG